MATVFLKSVNGTADDIALSTAAEIFGTTDGNENVYISDVASLSDTAKVVMDANIEGFTLAGLASDYLFSAGGNTVTIYKANKPGVAIATIVVQADGTAVTFLSAAGAAANTTLAIVTNLDGSFYVKMGTEALPTTAPVMSSAAVATDGKSIVITYSEALTGTVEFADYAVTGATVTAAAIGTNTDDNKVTLTLSSAVLASATVSNIVYTASAGTADSIKDAATAPNSAATQTLATVTNNSTAVATDTTVPAVAVTSTALSKVAAPVVSGTAEAGSTVTAVIAGATYEVVATNGSWSIDTATATPKIGTTLALNVNGDNTVSVTAVDAAGNSSAAPATQTLVIDTTVPIASLFTATATTVGATSDEAGTLGLYDGSEIVIGGPVEFPTSGGLTQTIDVSAQSTVVNAILKISDTAGNFATATQSVVLGTVESDSTLSGTSGDDFIFGFAGDDTISGGTGNDIFTVAGVAGTTTITDLATGDILTVDTGITAVAAATTGFIATTATTNAAVNTAVVLTAAAAGATIDMAMAGGSTGYTLAGGAGADTLTGSGSADIFTGAAGKDVITLGIGADIVRYNTVATSAAAAGAQMDSITDFLAGTDKINLVGDTGAGAVLTGVTVVVGTTTASALATEVANAATLATVADLYTALGTDTTLTASGGGAAGIVAQVYSFANGALAGKYLVINDATTGFQTTDIVINLTGVSGIFSAGDLTFTA